jgi:single-stranded-DNA-specific exonuclease recJ
MQLKDENRIIVRYGLRALEKTKNLGLRALLQVCELENKELTAYHIGFIIGPCLNASGRLKTAKLALELLMSKDMETAKQRAMELKRLNDERKDMTQQGVDQAIEIVEAAPEEKVLVVYLSDCHESLAGIIAGRLRERYQRPAIVLTDAQEEGMLKGSGRSIGAYPMFEKLCEADGFLEKYGGHPMAAGLSLKKENVEAFRRFLNEHSKLVESNFVKEVWIDVAMPFGYISEDLVAQLAQLAPFGQGNESPTFAQKDVEILNARVLGKDHNVVRLSLKDSAGTRMEGLVFTDGDAFIEEAKRFIDIIYAPQVNEYMGQRTLQVVIRDWKFKSK